MTQKELSYVSDAVMHEESIIKIIDKLLNNLENEELVTFMKDETEKHTKMKEKLLSLMEEHAND